MKEGFEDKKPSRRDVLKGMAGGALVAGALGAAAKFEIPEAEAAQNGAGDGMNLETERQAEIKRETDEALRLVQEIKKAHDSRNKKLEQQLAQELQEHIKRAQDLLQDFLK